MCLTQTEKETHAARTQLPDVLCPQGVEKEKMTWAPFVAQDLGYK